LRHLSTKASEVDNALDMKAPETLAERYLSEIFLSQQRFSR